MKREHAWPLGITAVLAAVVGVNIWVAVLANDDPSFAVEPDYYAKAVAWDSSMAQARANASLGWSVTPALTPFTTSGGAQLAVRVMDAQGAPVSDATVQVTAFFNGRASVTHTATLAPQAPGRYTATLPVDHAGAWEFRFNVQRGSVRFTTSARIDAEAGTP